MPNVTLNVPQPVIDAVQALAAAQGKTPQQYILDLVKADAKEREIAAGLDAAERKRVRAIETAQAQAEAAAATDRQAAIDAAEAKYG